MTITRELALDLYRWNRAQEACRREYEAHPIISPDRPLSAAEGVQITRRRHRLDTGVCMTCKERS